MLPPDFEPDEDDERAAAATYSVLVEGVRKAVGARVLVGDPKRIALHLWVVAHGMISFELSGHLPIEDTAAAEAYDEALTLAAMPFIPHP